MQPRGQSAVEYLTTYGFLILVVAIVIAILVFLSTVPNNSLPTSCTVYGSLKCSELAFGVNTLTGHAQIIVLAYSSVSGVINISGTNGFSAVMGGVPSTSGYCSSTGKAQEPTKLVEGQEVECVANFPSNIVLYKIYTGTFNISANYCSSSTAACLSSTAYTFTGSWRAQATPISVIPTLTTTSTTTTHSTVSTSVLSTTPTNPTSSIPTSSTSILYCAYNCANTCNYFITTNTLGLSFTVFNNYTNATTSPYDKAFVIDPLNSSIQKYEASNLGNIRFYQGSTELDSWCESGCNSSAPTAVFWVKIPASIPGKSNTIVNLSLLSKSTNYDDNFAGEAPTYSTSQVNGAPLKFVTANAPRLTQYLSYLPSFTSANQAGSLSAFNSSPITFTTANTYWTFTYNATPIPKNVVGTVEPLTSNSQPILFGTGASSSNSGSHGVASIKLPSSYQTYYCASAINSNNDNDAINYSSSNNDSYFYVSDVGLQSNSNNAICYGGDEFDSKVVVAAIGVNVPYGSVSQETESTNNGNPGVLDQQFGLSYSHQLTAILIACGNGACDSAHGGSISVPSGCVQRQSLDSDGHESVYIATCASLNPQGGEYSANAISSNPNGNISIAIVSFPNLTSKAGTINLTIPTLAGNNNMYLCSYAMNYGNSPQLFPLLIYPPSGQGVISQPASNSGTAIVYQKNNATCYTTDQFGDAELVAAGIGVRNASAYFFNQTSGYETTQTQLWYNVTQSKSLTVLIASCAPSSCDGSSNAVAAGDSGSITVPSGCSAGQIIKDADGHETAYVTTCTQQLGEYPITLSSSVETNMSVAAYVIPNYTEYSGSINLNSLPPETSYICGMGINSDNLLDSIYSTSFDSQSATSAIGNQSNPYCSGIDVFSSNIVMAGIGVGSLRQPYSTYYGGARNGNPLNLSYSVSVANGLTVIAVACGDGACDGSHGSVGSRSQSDCVLRNSIDHDALESVSIYTCNSQSPGSYYFNFSSINPNQNITARAFVFSNVINTGSPINFSTGSTSGVHVCVAAINGDQDQDDINQQYINGNPNGGSTYGATGVWVSGTTANCIANDSLGSKMVGAGITVNSILGYQTYVSAAYQSQTGANLTFNVTQPNTMTVIGIACGDGACDSSHGTITVPGGCLQRQLIDSDGYESASIYTCNSLSVGLHQIHTTTKNLYYNTTFIGAYVFSTNTRTTSSVSLPKVGIGTDNGIYVCAAAMNDNVLAYDRISSSSYSPLSIGSGDGGEPLYTQYTRIGSQSYSPCITSNLNGSYIASVGIAVPPNSNIGIPTTYTTYGITRYSTNDTALSFSTTQPNELTVILVTCADGACDNTANSIAAGNKGYITISPSSSCVQRQLQDVDGNETAAIYTCNSLPVGTYTVTANTVAGFVNDQSLWQTNTIMSIGAYVFTNISTINYGKYDNGANVFPFYTNFSGTTIGSSWSVLYGNNLIVNNGLVLNGTSSPVIALSSKYSRPFVEEAYFNTSYPTGNSTSAVQIPVMLGYADSLGSGPTTLHDGYLTTAPNYAITLNITKWINAAPYSINTSSNSVIPLGQNYYYNSISQSYTDAPYLAGTSGLMLGPSLLKDFYLYYPLVNATDSLYNNFYPLITGNKAALVSWFRIRTYPPNGGSTSVNSIICLNNTPTSSTTTVTSVTTTICSGGSCPPTTAPTTTSVSTVSTTTVCQQDTGPVGSVNLCFPNNEPPSTTTSVTSTTTSTTSSICNPGDPTCTTTTTSSTTSTTSTACQSGDPACTTTTTSTTTSTTSSICNPGDPTCTTTTTSTTTTSTSSSTSANTTSIPCEPPPYTSTCTLTSSSAQCISTLTIVKNFTLTFDPTTCTICISLSCLFTCQVADGTPAQSGSGSFPDGGWWWSIAQDWSYNPCEPGFACTWTPPTYFTSYLWASDCGTTSNPPVIQDSTTITYQGPTSSS